VSRDPELRFTRPGEAEAVLFALDAALADVARREAAAKRFVSLNRGGEDADGPSREVLQRARDRMAQVVEAVHPLAGVPIA
jgi:hypothetical protein